MRLAIRKRDQMDIDFQKKLLETFKVETKEHLAAISACLIDLEKSGEVERRQAIIEAVSREAHSLKGAARAVNMAGIEALSHALEGVFAVFKRRTDVPSPMLFDLLHQSVDTIDNFLPLLDIGRDDTSNAFVRELVLNLEKSASGFPPLDGEERDAGPETKGHGFIGKAAALAQTEAQNVATGHRADYEAGTAARLQAASPDSIRISTGKLDSLFSQTEELLTVKLAASQRAVELYEISSDMALWEKEWRKLRPVVRNIRKARQSPAGGTLLGKDHSPVDRLLEFFEWNHTCIKKLENKMQRVAKTAANDRHTLDGMVDTLLDDMKGALMLPVATILKPLPKVARDLARDRGKEAELVLEGGAVECDKRILEEIKDPLIHLIRNCIDHGIESPEKRKLKGKPARGKIRVTVTLMDSHRMELCVADDGAGVDIARLPEMAVKRGLVTRDEIERMGKEELLGVIFTSGFSSRPMIDDISGRGLGLAIVREKVAKLGGTVTVATDDQHGTTFSLLLPLTLSTFRGIIVRVGEQPFIFPAPQVEKVARIPRGTVKSVENRETVELGGTVLSFARLADLLELPRLERKDKEPDFVQLFVLDNGGRRLAIGVDEVLGEQEVLVKSLGGQLARVRNIAGAAVLGTGKVVPILHPGDLLKSAAKGTAMAGTVPAMEHPETARKSILIAEDSITARTLLRNIIESAGYETVSAVDGLDALALLRTEEIDLVVSDVDMPRLNGFELTTRIRASREFADLPVLLVTSLDSREDRERGIEAGANAYIVKSSFDQSNLLDTIKRFI
jgi:two-component system chemotaxis sensor kinase CheA